MASAAAGDSRLIRTAAALERNLRLVSREGLLVRTFVELADTLADDFDITDFLYLLCERSVELIPVDEAGVLLVADDGTLDVAAASGDEMRRLELFETQNLQGPCVEAHRTGQRIDVADLRSSRDRWPDFVDRALEVGLRSVHARPLRARDRVIGAINMFGRDTGELDEADAEVARGLADIASIGIAQKRALSSADKDIVNLRQALDGRRVVDQAVAVLADRRGRERDEAFHVLRAYARAHSARLRDVAQRLLDGQLDDAEVWPSEGGRGR
jgi:GAF domain-containing protein